MVLRTVSVSAPPPGPLLAYHQECLSCVVGLEGGGSSNENTSPALRPLVVERRRSRGYRPARRPNEVPQGPNIRVLSKMGCVQARCIFLDAPFPCRSSCSSSTRTAWSSERRAGDLLATGFHAHIPLPRLRPRHIHDVHFPTSGSLNSSSIQARPCVAQLRPPSLGFSAVVTGGLPINVR